MRNLKILGLALVAMFAMSVVVASVASADTLTAESYPATLTGAQEENDKFTTTSGTVQCTTTTYHTLLGAGSKDVTATPTYAGCSFLGFPATVDTNGCSYTFTMTDVVTDAATTSRVDIVCPAGQEITVTAIAAGTTKCTVHVPPQVTLSHIEWVNIGAGQTREVTGKVTISGLKYSHTAGSGLGACPSGSSNTGEYHGTAKVTGEKVPPATGHVGVFFSL